jgi:cob(I)alamin adenosyltransferase
MKIYTRTGDKGTTGLFGGERVSKDNPRIVAYGTVDETNSFIGLARAFLSGTPGAEEIDPVLKDVQSDLFVVGADLATPLGAKPTVPRMDAASVKAIEDTIDRFDPLIPPLKQFVLPGGTVVAAQLHVARTVCRRAERQVIELMACGEINPHVLTYLNRLSDLLFVLARLHNHLSGTADIPWIAPTK